MSEIYVHAARAEEFVTTLAPGSVHLLAFDPPYCDVSRQKYDRRWKTAADYADWLVEIIRQALPALTSDGSVVFFGGLGHHGHRPLFEVMQRLEKPGFGLTCRDMITWKKRRAIGVGTRYLYCREEILWYAVSDKNDVRFNIPLLDEKRGYAGFSAKYPAKSEFKRVSNVWADIPELMRPKRPHQKPLPLMERIVATHSYPGDVVCDPFAGWGTTLEAAIKLGRRAVGCEEVAQDAADANERCVAMAELVSRNSDSGPDLSSD